MKKELPDIFIRPSVSIKSAMRIIDKAGLGLAFVINDQGSLQGLLTDGDIRKAILKGIDIGERVKGIMNTHPASIQGKLTQQAIDELSLRKDIIPSGGSLKVPVVDVQGKITNILLLYADEQKQILVAKPILSLKQKYVAVKKVLIVGGAGYMGSALSQLLLRNNFSVRVLDNLTYGDHGIKHLLDNKKFSLYRGDCRNISDVIEAMRGVDAVIHLAAIVGDPACAIDPRQTLENNYLATMALAQSAKFNQINKFLFASSCSVYGASVGAQDRLHERSPLNPVSLYAQTKIKSEEALLQLADRNFSPTIYRFATLYGLSTRMRFDLVINILTAKAIREKAITIFGGEQYRPFIDVSDAARGCMAWLKAPLHKVGGEIFNVGSNAQNLRISEIGEIIKDVIPGVIVSVKQTSTDLRNYNVSFDKIASTLKFSPRKTIRQAIKDIHQLIKKENITNFSHPQYNNYEHVISVSLK